jgi:hypothetical protein
VRVGLRGDLQPFVHDSLTSYVIVITNTGVGSQLFSFAVDFRLMFPGEDEGLMTEQEQDDALQQAENDRLNDLDGDGD